MDRGRRGTCRVENKAEKKLGTTETVKPSSFWSRIIGDMLILNFLLVTINIVQDDFIL